MACPDESQSTGYIHSWAMRRWHEERGWEGFEAGRRESRPKERPSGLQLTAVGCWKENSQDGGTATALGATTPMP